MIVVIIRTTLVYLLLIVSVRLMGKRQIGELAPSDLVTTILISNLASLPMEDIGLAMFSIVLPILLIVSFEILISCASVKSSAVSGIISGQSKTVIRNGEIIESALKDLRYTCSDLMESLRNKNVYDFRTVEFGVMETNGSLNIKLFDKDNSGAQAQDYSPVLLPVVCDGSVSNEFLNDLSMDESQLNRLLNERGYRVSELLIALSDCNQNLYCVRKAVL